MLSSCSLQQKLLLDHDVGGVVVLAVLVLPQAVLQVLVGDADLVEVALDLLELVAVVPVVLVELDVVAIRVVEHLAVSCPGKFCAFSMKT